MNSNKAKREQKRKELEAMSHEELVQATLEMQKQIIEMSLMAQELNRQRYGIKRDNITGTAYNKLFDQMETLVNQKYVKDLMEDIDAESVAKEKSKKQSPKKK